MKGSTTRKIDAPAAEIVPSGIQLHLHLLKKVSHLGILGVAGMHHACLLVVVRVAVRKFLPMFLQLQAFSILGIR
jgi:hypothetical protein